MMELLMKIWIIGALKEKGINLSREEIDHIIWYGFKGN